MLATTTRHALVLALLCCFSVVRGQEPKPAELRQANFAGGRTILLDWAWRFQAGDDPRWAEPACDDSGWEIAEPLLPPEGFPTGGWPGVGWFRRHLRLEPALAGIGGVYVFGMLALAVGMSLFLAGTFARTSTHLERRLAEVRALSEQVLAQERAALEQELRRRLLEAEDARKGSEIAAARHLQLSMLPASLPRCWLNATAFCAA